MKTMREVEHAIMFGTGPIDRRVDLSSIPDGVLRRLDKKYGEDTRAFRYALESRAKERQGVLRVQRKGFCAVALASRLGVKEGDRITVDVVGDTVVIRKLEVNDEND